jgi:hypothetical protein
MLHRSNACSSQVGEDNIRILSMLELSALAILAALVIAHVTARIAINKADLPPMPRGPFGS